MPPGRPLQRAAHAGAALGQPRPTRQTRLHPTLQCVNECPKAATACPRYSMRDRIWFANVLTCPSIQGCRRPGAETSRKAWSVLRGRKQALCRAPGAQKSAPWALRGAPRRPSAPELRRCGRLGRVGPGDPPGDGPEAGIRRSFPGCSSPNAQPTCRDGERRARRRTLPRLLPAPRSHTRCAGDGSSPLARRAPAAPVPSLVRAAGSRVQGRAAGVGGERGAGRCLALSASAFAIAHTIALVSGTAPRPRCFAVVNDSPTGRGGRAHHKSPRRRSGWWPPEPSGSAPPTMTRHSARWEALMNARDG